MLLRRSLVRAVPRTRGFAAAAGEGSYVEKQEALKAHAAGMCVAFKCTFPFALDDSLLTTDALYVLQRPPTCGDVSGELSSRSLCGRHCHSELITSVWAASSFVHLAVSCSIFSFHETFLKCISIVLVTTLWVIKVEKEHAAHEEHIKEEHGGQLPEIPRYPYLNVRSAYSCPFDCPPSRYSLYIHRYSLPMGHEQSVF